MLSAVRSGSIGRWRAPPQLLTRLFSSSPSSSGTSPARPQAAALLELSEVEKVLRDVRAGDVRVFPVGEGGLHGGACADYMVVATGRSDWHVRNIAQALLYKARTTTLNFPFLCLPREERNEGFFSLSPGSSQPAIFLVIILPWTVRWLLVWGIT